MSWITENEQKPGEKKLRMSVAVTDYIFGV